MILAAMLIVAANQAAASPQPPIPTFGSEARVVRLDVLVLDGNKSVTGLRAEDFEVRDNGTVQDIQVRPASDTPLDLFLVLDASASISGRRREELLRAASGVVEALGTQDWAALVTLSDNARLAVPLTSDRSALASGLEQARPAGSTALHDGIYAAMLLPGRDDTRRLAIVFTDGNDNVSWLSRRDVLQASRRGETTVYVVTSRDSSKSFRTTWTSLAGRVDTDFAREVASATGGRVFDTGAARSLQRTFRLVLDEAATRYVIGYTPTSETEGWHEVTVRLTRRKGNPLTRRGYFATVTPWRQR